MISSVCLVSLGCDKMNEASDVTGCLVSGSPIGVGLDLLELLQFLILIFSVPVQIEFFSNEV